MAKKTITLYIDDSSLRLLVAQGRRVKKWAESVLEPGLVKNGVVVEETEVADRVKQLFKTQKVGQTKIVVGVSGMHCLTRPMVLPALPRPMLGEAVVREAKRVLPVPTEQLYISWQLMLEAEGKMQVYVVAIPCKTADALLQMLHKAGLKPYLMEIKPLALARLSKEPTAIILDVQSTEFDILVMSAGIPQPIRSVPLPAEELSPEEKWQKVREELDRTIKFYNANNPGKVIGPEVPVYVSGEFADRPQFTKSLSEEFGLTVSPLPSPIRSQGMDAARYMVNMGLALKESSAREARALAVNINALPVPYRPKPLPVLKIVSVPAAVAFIGIVIVLVSLVQEAAANVSDTKDELDKTNATITQRQNKKKELTASIADLEKKSNLVQTSHKAFSGALAVLDRQHERIKGDLLLTTGNLSPTVSLTSINQTAAGLGLHGVARDEEEILAYARSLETSGRFSEITISTITELKTGGMGFTLALKVKG